MTTTLGKTTYSRLTRTSTVKSKEQEELDKLNEVISNLKQAVNYKDGNLSSLPNAFSSIKRSRSNGINKSNIYKLSISRTKEDRSNKEFLRNFIYIEDKIVSPQNMHLLTDDDTNQSISSKQKFKNLANLMMDDKESVVEKSFDHNDEEKYILQLYTALSKKSKEVFVENDIEKLEKLQLFFKRINKIKMPKINIKSNSNSNLFSSEKGKELNNEEFTSFFKSDLPIITADFLSNINHNLINIEDIYNSDSKKSYTKNEETDIVPIKAFEIQESESFSRSFDGPLDSKRSGINLFSDFCNSCPKQEFYIIERDIPSIEQFEKNKLLQENYNNKIALIGELDDRYFPKGNLSLNNKSVLKFAQNNKENIEERTDSFTIYSQLLTDIQTFFLNQNKENNNNESNNNNNNESNNNNNNENENNNESNNDFENIINESNNYENKNSNKSSDGIISDSDIEDKVNKINGSRRASIINNLLVLYGNSSENESSNNDDEISKKKSSEDVFSRFSNFDY